MTEEEYKDNFDALTKEYNASVARLQKQYISENTKYHKGDIIEDRIGKICIEKISFGSFIRPLTPIPMYIGTDLKKDGTPKKNQQHTIVFGTNIVGGWEK